jgi:hypothetical protein
VKLEATIEQVLRCTSKPCLSKIGDALRGNDRARLEEFWDAVKL